MAAWEIEIEFENGRESVLFVDCDKVFVSNYGELLLTPSVNVRVGDGRVGSVDEYNYGELLKLCPELFSEELIQKCGDIFNPDYNERLQRDYPNKFW